ncbi:MULTISPECIES: hypothetical protein [unclassified Bradyrhizobium]|uniref:hypothetical protein n=1 Tax=unclassified Bradyrhizobium TaxID=2631580 RepID=UPI0033915035
MFSIEELLCLAGDILIVLRNLPERGCGLWKLAIIGFGVKFLGTPKPVIWGVHSFHAHGQFLHWTVHFLMQIKSAGSRMRVNSKTGRVTGCDFPKLNSMSIDKLLRSFPGCRLIGDHQVDPKLYVPVSPDYVSSIFAHGRAVECFIQARLEPV